MRVFGDSQAGGPSHGTHHGPLHWQLTGLWLFLSFLGVDSHAFGRAAALGARSRPVLDCRCEAGTGEQSEWHLDGRPPPVNTEYGRFSGYEDPVTSSLTAAPLPCCRAATLPCCHAAAALRAGGIATLEPLWCRG